MLTIILFVEPVIEFLIIVFTFVASSYLQGKGLYKHRPLKEKWIPEKEFPFMVGIIPAQAGDNIMTTVVLHYKLNVYD